MIRGFAGGRIDGGLRLPLYTRCLRSLSARPFPITFPLRPRADFLLISILTPRVCQVGTFERVPPIFPFALRNEFLKLSSVRQFQNFKPDLGTLEGFYGVEIKRTHSV